MKDYEIDDFKYIKQRVNQEGFHYCFINYSDFKDEIKDKEFHKLRKAYIKSAKKLEQYINDKAENQEYDF